jgi:drug/metabolite transporter (DMT)-like permease
MKPNDSYRKYALTTILFWSIAFPFTHMAMQHFSAYGLGLTRYALASAALLPVVIVKKLKPPKRKDAGWFLLAGALGFALYMVVFNIGNNLVTSATASIMLAVTPVLTALLAQLFFREKLKPVKWIAVAVEFSGILILALWRGVFAVNQGILWLMAAVVCISLYNLIQRRLTKTYSSLQSAVYIIFCGTFLLLVFLPQGIAELRTASLGQFLYVVLLGVFPSAVAYVTWSAAFQRAHATSDVSNYMFITPFLSGVAGFLLNGELPDAATLLGGAVILAGVLVFNYRGPRSVAPGNPTKGTSSL